MRKSYQSLSKVLFLAVFALLSACGGGGSGGGATQQYNGAANLFLSSPGVAPSNLGTFGINVSISGSNVTVTDSDGLAAKGKITDSTFSASASTPLGDIGDGIICGDITIIYTGTLNGATIIGNISGGVNCTQSGVTVPFALSGNFSASAVAKAYGDGSVDFVPMIKAAFEK